MAENSCGVNGHAAVIAGMRSELDASYRIIGIGIAVPGLVNTFNPDAIVLHGFLGILHALSPDALDGLLRTQALD